MKQEIELRPLTKKNKGGELYTRLPAVDSQIRMALGLEGAAFQETIDRRDFDSDGFVSEEALVHLIRHYAPAGSDAVTDVLVVALAERFRLRVHRIISAKLDESYVEECFRDIVASVISTIYEDSPDRCDFAEVRFWVWLDAKVFNILRGYVREQVLAARTESLDDQGEDDAEDEVGLSLQPQATTLSPDLDYDLWEALSNLTKRERTIFIMRHVEGWEIKSTDPNSRTISQWFGVTDRTVRNWFDKIDEKLKRWREAR